MFLKSIFIRNTNGEIMQKQNALSLVNPLTNGRLATRLTYRTSVTLYLSYFQLTIHPYDFYGV
jgi:hypothetical protein